MKRSGCRFWFEGLRSHWGPDPQKLVCLSSIFLTILLQSNSVYWHTLLITSYMEKVCVAKVMKRVQIITEFCELCIFWTIEPFFFNVYCQVKYIMQNSDLLCRYRSQGVFTTFEKMYLVFSKLPNGKLKHWRWVHHYHRECKWSWHVLALCTRQETTVGGRVGWGVSCCTKWQTILISGFSCAGVEDTPCGKQAYREECRDQPRLWAREPEEIIPPQCVRVRLWGGTRGTWVCAAPSSVSVIKTT